MLAEIFGYDEKSIKALLWNFTILDGRPCYNEKDFLSNFDKLTKANLILDINSKLALPSFPYTKEKQLFVYLCMQNRRRELDIYIPMLLGDDQPKIDVRISKMCEFSIVQRGNPRKPVLEGNYTTFICNDRRLDKRKAYFVSLDLVPEELK